MLPRALALLFLLWLPCLALAQTRVMPLGDSITNGGQTYVSYRYTLWFQLLQAGYDVDFVGVETTLFGGSTPNSLLYPNYANFDVDHEGRWGWRTDEVDGVISASAAAVDPHIVLIHLGTNDIGQQGAAGVTNADTYLRSIIGRLRAVRSDVIILLAQVIDIGVMSGYGANAGQVAPLNAAIAMIAADLSTGPSPVIVVDQNTGFDVNTMFQNDDLHPNEVGEDQMATVWFNELTNHLTPGNPLPQVSITSPLPGAGYTAPASVAIDATATDNGSITQVEFFADALSLGVDLVAPYSVTWNGVASGTYVLTAVATDDQMDTTTSTAVPITVVPAGTGIPIAILNHSFEDPVLADIALASGPGVVGNWTFAGTANTYTGIFNPPAGSYTSAGGNATPTGADGTNVAFLFNNGGPAESVSATQVLAETVLSDMEYSLTVAIGKFLETQPYDFSIYGGYVLELLAGTTVIGSQTDVVDPAMDSFTDATLLVSTVELDPGLVGQPLAIRLNISDNVEDRSTHFDNVRLSRFDGTTSVAPSPAASWVRIQPNPSNPRATVEFSLPRASVVGVDLYDVRGRRVRQLLVSTRLGPGPHSVAIDHDLPSGVYLVKVTTPDRHEVHKMIRLK